MSKKDVREEQLALLRFKKEITSMAETLAAGATVAQSTDSKLETAQAASAYEEIKAALMNLAEVTDKAHENLRTRAVEMGHRFVGAAPIFNPDGKVSNKVSEPVSLILRS